jgi:hemerythrin-like domain-containing protein
MKTAPIKRDKRILVLSKDHHFGLLVNWKIKKGLDLKVEPERIANFVINFWETHLAAHFIAEEQVLFAKINNSLKNKALAQHKQLRGLINNIRENSTLETLINFANLLENHIRFEEREVFKMIQQELNEEELNEIGRKLQEIHPEPFEDNYKDNFWIISA